MKCRTWPVWLFALVLAPRGNAVSEAPPRSIPLAPILEAASAIAAAYPEPDGGDPSFRRNLAEDRRDLARALSGALDTLATTIRDPQAAAGTRRLSRELAGEAADLPAAARGLRALARQVPAERVPGGSFDTLVDAVEERARAWAAARPDLPARLSRTGLYRDIRCKIVAPGNHPFAPQYPLWSDGAAKMRWIRLPPGAKIDTTRPDRWEFPVGTTFWKEFSFDGRRVETRLMRKMSAPASPLSWRYATYRWNEDETEAMLVPAIGVTDVASTGPGTSHDLPSVRDCLRCHSRGGDAVLGFDALQLSPDRDPLAPHAPKRSEIGLTTDDLVRTGRIDHVIRVTQPGPPIHRAALGYLHGNCGHCHNPLGPLGFLEMDLRHTIGSPPAALRTALGRRTRIFEVPGRRLGTTSRRLSPGDSSHSAIRVRASRRGPHAEPMPPIATEIPDAAALALLDRWISSLR